MGEGKTVGSWTTECGIPGERYGVRDLGVKVEVLKFIQVLTWAEAKGQGWQQEDRATASFQPGVSGGLEVL